MILGYCLVGMVVFVVLLLAFLWTPILIETLQMGLKAWKDLLGL